MLQGKAGNTDRHLYQPRLLAEPGVIDEDDRPARARVDEIEALFGGVEVAVIGHSKGNRRVELPSAAASMSRSTRGGSPGSRSNNADPTAPRANRTRARATRNANGGRTSARVAIPLSTTFRSGRWLTIRADFPTDVFVHARHLKDGIACGGSGSITRHLHGGNTTVTPPLPPCPVEECFDGAWYAMVETLARTFNITELERPAEVRVRPRFSMGVAPDVGMTKPSFTPRCLV